MNTHAPYNAADELDRRAANRTLKAQGLPTDRGPATPEGTRLQHMSAEALRTEAAGRLTPARKPARVATPTKAARKSTRTPAQQAATAARKLAWAHMVAERKAGNKCTYAAACAEFGTTPAKAK